MRVGLLEGDGPSYPVLQGRHKLSSMEDAEAVAKAAQAGHADAMRLVGMMVAAGIGCRSDWNAALAWQVAAAEAGDDDAQSEIIVLSADGDYCAYLADLAREGRTLPADDWRRLASSVNWNDVLSPPAPETISSTPAIGVARDMASQQLCAWLIARAINRVVRATVVDDATGRPRIDDSVRTSSVVAAPFASGGLPLVALRERMATDWLSRLAFRDHERHALWAGADL